VRAIHIFRSEDAAPSWILRIRECATDVLAYMNVCPASKFTVVHECATNVLDVGTRRLEQW